MFLIADSRESVIIPFLKSLIECESKQIPVGDYIIQDDDENIYACIERKTLVDYAASLKDGRYENFGKMVDLREKTNCKLYLLIEGPAFPSKSRLFARVAYSTIEKSIMELSVAHNIQVIYSENAICTAEKLKLLYDAICDMRGLVVAGGGGFLAESDEQLCVKMWANLPKVSVKQATKIITLCSCADIITGVFTDYTLFKYSNGRAFQKPTTTVLSRLNTRDIFYKLIAGIKGISAEYANKITCEPAELCTKTVEEIAELQVNGKSIGKCKAEKIRKFLHFKLC